ncbi:MAG: hypothetical protein BMS9Abin20_0184 [Acidimicrobiia bacterium]|nr:MAG: hypothetical protein BMS9Abin20_0184 [Acidimicrobiia bacterium]
MRKFLFIFALLAIALSACRAESNVILTIEEDGSATVGAEMGFDQEFRDLLEQAGFSADDMVSRLSGSGGEDLQPILRTDGDMTYFGASSSVDDLSTLDLSTEGMDFFSEFFSVFSYEFDDSSARLTATVESPDFSGGGENFPFDPSAITREVFSANVIVSMPGTVGEHNADEIRSDGTLVWNIPLTGSTTIVATSEYGSGSNSWIFWVLGGVLIVGIVAAATAMIVSRKEAEKAVATAAAAYAASTQEAPPPVVESTEDASTEDESDTETENAPSDDDADEPSDGDSTDRSDADQPEST